MLDVVLHLGERATRILRAVVKWAVIVFYSYMAIAVLFQVLARYVTGAASGWAAETATFAQIWMVLLAAGIAMQRNLHVGVDILAAMLPPAAIRLLTLAIGIVCCIFLWLAVEGSGKLIAIGRIQSSPALGIPMWIPYLSLPIGLTYFAFELVLALLRKWRDPKPAAEAAGGKAAP